MLHGLKLYTNLKINYDNCKELAINNKIIFTSIERLTVKFGLSIF